MSNDNAFFTSFFCVFILIIACVNVSHVNNRMQNIVSSDLMINDESQFFQIFICEVFYCQPRKQLFRP